MKAKLLLLLFITTSLSSCIKDYIGDGPDKVILTEENHLSANALFVIYANEEIVRLDDIIGNPEQYSEEEVKTAEVQRATLKTQVANTTNIYTVFDIPRPCPNDPGGKCVPSRLEYFPFPQNIQEGLVRATSKDGDIEGVSDDLRPLPGFESDLQFIRVPIENVETLATLELAWKDAKGDITSFKVTFD